MQIILSYILTLLPLVVLDALWLGLLARPYYVKQLGSLMNDRIVWSAAILFYLLFPIGILKFAVLPALEVGEWKQALINGALLGFLAYGAYDLTNMATLRGWTWELTIVDMLWGTAVSAATAVIALFLIRLAQ